MDAEKYEQLIKDYWQDASWAIWDIIGWRIVGKSRYEIHKHLDNYEEIKDRIKPNVVLVGLNQSLKTPIKETFSNFHFFENDKIKSYENEINEKGLVMSSQTVKNAEKLPYTFRGTEYEGAYMTDIIKFKTISGKVKSNAKSEDVMAYIRKHPEVEKENIKIFEDELKIIGSENPLIIAFGGNVNEILRKYFDVCQVTHYSHYIGKEKYREETLEKIKSYLTRNNEFTTDEKLKIIKKEGTFTDPRDGKVYKTVKIGEQVWMAENLAYDAGEYRYHYDWETAKEACPPGWHLPTNEEWQTLVDFAGGKDIAGEKLKAKRGWNTDKWDYSGECSEMPEFNKETAVVNGTLIIDYSGGEYIAKKKMEAKSGWDTGNGTDDFGFSALPMVGVYEEDNLDCSPAGAEYRFGSEWWSSSEYSSGSAYYWYIYGTNMRSNVYGKSHILNVRCIKD